MQAGPPVTQLPVDTTEHPPKRGPGRPRGSRTRTDAPSRARAQASLEVRIGGMLMVLNAMVMVVPGAARDALDSVELAALAKALDDECHQNARFRRYMEAALRAGSGGQLLGVVAIIAGRRASRHGLVAPELDGQLGAILAGLPQPPTPPPAPFPGPIPAEPMTHDGSNNGSG